MRDLAVFVTLCHKDTQHAHPIRSPVVPNTDIVIIAPVLIYAWPSSGPIDPKVSVDISAYPEPILIGI
jgi:hypothetical protein